MPAQLSICGRGWKNCSHRIINLSLKRIWTDKNFANRDLEARGGGRCLWTLCHNCCKTFITKYKRVQSRNWKHVLLMLKIQCMRTGGGLPWASLRLLNWESKLRLCVAYACNSVWWREEDCPGRAWGCWTESLNWEHVLLMLVTVYEDGRTDWPGGQASGCWTESPNWGYVLLMLATVMMTGRGLPWVSLRLLNWESKLRLCVAYACYSVRGREEDCPERASGCWTESLNWEHVLLMLNTVYEDGRRTALGEPQVAELRV